MLENPFKIEKGVAAKKKFDQTLLLFLVDSLKELKQNSDECVFIPKEVLSREKAYSYVSKATGLLRHEIGALKFTIRSIKEDKEEVGIRVFRIR